MKIELEVKCVGCGHKKIVDEKQRTQPICDKCGMPMIPNFVKGQR
jgi:ribosomal protein S27E